MGRSSLDCLQTCAKGVVEHAVAPWLPLLSLLLERTSARHGAYPRPLAVTSRACVSGDGEQENRRLRAAADEAQQYKAMVEELQAKNDRLERQIAKMG